MMRCLSRWLITATAITLLGGCAGTSSRPPILTADYVDLERFMGDWYVIANIPTFLEKDAYNAVESYALAEQYVIDTTFTFRKGGFDGKQKTYRPTGYVEDTQSNAVWGMQFIWPFKGDYRVVFVDDGYNQTVIGRNKRDYVWIMARTPSIPDADYQRLLRLIEGQGYDIGAVRKVPQRW